jgi:hypothetical protein
MVSQILAMYGTRMVISVHYSPLHVNIMSQINPRLSAERNLSNKLPKPHCNPIPTEHLITQNLGAKNIHKK